MTEPDDRGAHSADQDDEAATRRAPSIARIGLASIAAIALLGAGIAIAPKVTLRDALRPPDPAEAPALRERRVTPWQARAAATRLVAALRTFDDVSNDDTLGHRRIPWRAGLDVLDAEADRRGDNWRVIDPMRRWILRTLAAPQDLELASPIVVDWLHRHEPALIEAEAAMAATNWVPWSAEDSKRGWASFNEMQGVTGAHALACRDAGDPAGAERALLACWRIERWRRDWPTGRAVAVLRQVRPTDVEGWTLRLDRLRPREQLIRREERGVVSLADEMDLYGSAIDLPAWIPEGGAGLARYGLSWDTRRDYAAMKRDTKLLRERLDDLDACGDPASLATLPWSQPRAYEKQLRVVRDEEIAVAITRRVIARAAGIEEPPRPDDLCANPPLVERREVDGRLTIAWAGPAPADPTIWSLTSFTFTAP